MTTKTYKQNVTDPKEFDYLHPFQVTITNARTNTIIFRRVVAAASADAATEGVLAQLAHSLTDLYHRYTDDNNNKFYAIKSWDIVTEDLSTAEEPKE